MITISLRPFPILAAAKLAEGVPLHEPKDSARRLALDNELIQAARRLRRMIRANTGADKTCICDPADDELLGQGERVTDFFIHHLIDNYRWYTRYQIPEYSTIRIRTAPSGSLQRKLKTPQRRSGQVTGSFAEAMTPWVLQRLGVVTGDVFRLSSLSPGVFGKVLPDLVIDTVDGVSPCEVKHYMDVSEMTAGTLAKAIMQVVAGMIAFPATTGYLLAAIASEATSAPYRIEVIKFGT